MTETKTVSRPAETAGTEITRFNALRHGVLSRYTVLPWEDADEYRALIAALVAEHAPQGPTEEHLVEELTGIFWRKRRLRLAELAVHRRELKDRLSPYHETVKAALVHLDATDQSERVVDAIRATAADTEDDIADMEEDETMTKHALELLKSRRNDAYEAAMEALREDTRQWWEHLLARDPDDLDEDEEAATADAESLRQFLEREVLPWYETRRKELSNRSLIREQAFGESLDPNKLERLGRYEVHLDRKLERTLTMLISASGHPPCVTGDLIRFAKMPFRSAIALCNSQNVLPFRPNWPRVERHRLGGRRDVLPEACRAHGHVILKRTRHLHQVHHARAQKAGWDEMSQIREEVSFTKGRIIVRGKLVSRGKGKRADYVLYYKPNIPIALIEAKDNTHASATACSRLWATRRRWTSPLCFRRTATASCSMTGPATATETETTSRLDAFPSPGRSVEALPRLERPDA